MRARPAACWLSADAAGLQVVDAAIGQNLCAVDAGCLAVRAPQYIEHELGAVVELQAIPVPAAARGNHEVAPLVVHPSHARYSHGFSATPCERARNGEPRTRVVVGSAR